MDLDQLLTRAVQSGATDLHLKFGRPPAIRQDGQVLSLEGINALTAQDLETVLAAVTAVNPRRLPTSARRAISTSRTRRTTSPASG